MTTNDTSEALDAPLYYAHKVTKGDRAMYLHASPNRWWVDLHGVRDPVVALRIRERRDSDAPSDYWGWLDAKRPDHFVMVWPSRQLLDVCFPCGAAPEEARGKGRAVNLTVEEVSA